MNLLRTINCENRIFSLAATSDENFLAIKLEYLLLLIDLKSYRDVWKDKCNSFEHCHHIEFTPDNSHLIILDTGRFKIRNLKTGAIVSERPNIEYQTTTFSLSPNGKYLAIGCEQKVGVPVRVLVYDWPSGQFITKIDGSNYSPIIEHPLYYFQIEINDLVFSRDSQLLMCLSWDNLVIICDCVNWIPKYAPKLKRGSAASMGLIAPGNQLVCVEDMDGRLYLIHLPSSKTIWYKEFQKHIILDKTFIFTPDGKYLLYGDSEGGISIFETQGGTKVFGFKAHNEGISSLVLLSDRLISSSGNEVKIWDISQEMGHRRIRRIPSDKRSSRQSLIPNEPEVLAQLIRSIKEFFKTHLRIDIEEEVHFCNTYEKFIEIDPFYQKLPSKEKEIYMERELTSPIKQKGIFIPGSGAFINKEWVLIQFEGDIKGYLFELGTIIAHELIGHGLIIKQTAFGKSNELAYVLLFEKYKMDDRFADISTFLTEKQNELIFNAMKFTHEGWAEWIRGYFHTYFESPDLERRNLLIKRMNRTPFEFQNIFDIISYFNSIIEGLSESGIEYLNQIKHTISKQKVEEYISQHQRGINQIVSICSSILQKIQFFLQDHTYDFEVKRRAVENMRELSTMDSQFWFLNLRYILGILLFKRLEQKYGAQCLPEILNIIAAISPDVETLTLSTYFEDSKNHPDIKLGLLCIIPVDPICCNNIEMCKQIIFNYLGYKTKL